MGENIMEYTLANLVMDKAEKNVGKDKLYAVIKRIKTNPDFVLEDVALELKLQAFDAIQIIKNVRKEFERLPSSVLFELSKLIKDIKTRYNMKDIGENILGNEELANRYMQSIKFIFDRAREWIATKMIRVNRFMECALNLFNESCIALLDDIRALFMTLGDFVKSIKATFVDAIKAFGLYGYGDY